MPVYNGERFLREALDSILAQDYTDFELVIVDNQSTDSTYEICQAYAARDGRIRLFRNESNIGAAPNHNRAFELSRGKYFKWAAHDDVCLPGLVRRCVEAIEAPVGKGGAVLVAYPAAEFIDEEGGVTRTYLSAIACESRWAWRRMAQVILRMKWGIPMYGIMRSDALRHTRLIDSILASDYVLMAELAMMGRIRAVDEVLFRRRFHNERSLAINPSRESLLAWLDPRTMGRRDRWSERERLVIEYLKSVRNTPVGPFDKLTCLLTAATVEYVRDLQGRVERNKERLRRLVRRGSAAC